MEAHTHTHDDNEPSSEIPCCHKCKIRLSLLVWSLYRAIEWNTNSHTVSDDIPRYDMARASPRRQQKVSPAIKTMRNTSKKQYCTEHTIRRCIPDNSWKLNERYNKRNVKMETSKGIQQKGPDAKYTTNRTALHWNKSHPKNKSHQNKRTNHSLKKQRWTCIKQN